MHLIHARDPDHCARYVKAYNAMLALVPGFRDTLDDISGTDELVKLIDAVSPDLSVCTPAEIPPDAHSNHLLPQMEEVYRQARQDDTSSIRAEHGRYYLIDVKATPNADPEAPSIQAQHALLNKMQLGLNDMTTAEQLIPAHLWHDFQADPYGSDLSLHHRVIALTYKLVVPRQSALKPTQSPSLRSRPTNGLSSCMTTRRSTTQSRHRLISALARFHCEYALSLIVSMHSIELNLRPMAAVSSHHHRSFQCDLFFGEEEQRPPLSGAY